MLKSITGDTWAPLIPGLNRLHAQPEVCKLVVSRVVGPVRLVVGTDHRPFSLN